MIRPHRLAAALVLAAAVALAAPVNDRTARVATADGVRKALDQTTTLEFSDVPLQTVLTQIGDNAKVNVVLDKVSAMQTGQDPAEMHVTVRLKDVKLKAGLRSMLAQYNLSYVVLGDTLLVTTEEVGTTRLLRQPVDVDVSGEPLADSLKRIAQTTGTNLVVDPRQAKAAQSAVTLKLDEVPMETAVRLLAELAG